MQSFFCRPGLLSLTLLSVLLCWTLLVIVLDSRQQSHDLKQQVQDRHSKSTSTDDSSSSSLSLSNTTNSSSSSSSLTTQQITPASSSLTVSKSPYVNANPDALYRDILPSPSSSATTSNNHHNKSWCIIHVGPPKVATTTFQSILTAFSAELQQDGFVYSGKRIDENGNKWLGRDDDDVAGHFGNKKCGLQVLEARQTYFAKSASSNSTSSLLGTLKEVECFRVLFDSLMDLQRQGKSLIVSDEVLSYTLHETLPVWDTLQEVLTDRFHFQIVLGYRRWMDFLPSRFYQNQLNARVWKKWPVSGGVRLQPLFPQHAATKRMGPYTDNVLQKIARSKSEIPTRIFNMHAPTAQSARNAPTSLQTFLLCHVLFGKLPISCEKSIQLDQHQADERIEGGRKSFVRYDMLVVAAADAGLLHPQRIHRRVAEDQAWLYHETALQYRDFAMTCPERSDLEKLLQTSLQKEAAILPALHELENMEHTETFWKAALEKKKYCTIDTNATLQDSDWKQFFYNLTATTTTTTVHKNSNA